AGSAHAGALVALPLLTEILGQTKTSQRPVRDDQAKIQPPHELAARMPQSRTKGTTRLNFRYIAARVLPSSTRLKHRAHTTHSGNRNRSPRNHRKTGHRTYGVGCQDPRHRSG